MSVLKTVNLTKVYGTKKGQVVHKALDSFAMEVKQGEFVGIMGPSGSGKTTLLNLLATIDKPTSGSVEINGENPERLSNKQISLFRRRNLGFIFQDFNLLDTLTLRENIILPLVMEKHPPKQINQRVEEIAQQFGIYEVLDKRPYEVSGGQQQRAAAARAIIHQPTLILADEPTGNLDSKAAKSLMQTLAHINEQQQGTIVMVTHDPFAASYCRRILFIKDGQMFTELRRGDTQRTTFFQQILDVLSLLGGDHDELAPARL